MDIQNISESQPTSMRKRNISIHRPTIDYALLENKFLEKPANYGCLDTAKRGFNKHATCTPRGCARAVLSKFPFLHVMKSYDPKKFLTADIVSGICVGLVNIPQSLGYGVLAGLPPVYGLYTAFYPLLIYFIFGTSRHNSIGTMAITSMMLRTVVERESLLHPASILNHSTGGNQTAGTSTGLQQYRVEVALSLAFIVGIMQLAMAILQLGLVADFISPLFTDAFLTGSAFQIVTSQVTLMFGISTIVPLQTGLFVFPKTWYWIFRKLPKTNPADFIISVLCCTILYFIKEIINVKFKKKLRLPVPIPAELIVVVIATLASNYGKLSHKFGIRIVKTIPRGLPNPVIPTFPNVGDYLVDCFVISVVAVVINLSQARIMSRKHCYTIDTNQELLAYGTTNVFTSIFGGFVTAAAPPRTFVQDTAGGVTQICSIVSSLVILLICLVLGPLLQPLPMAALASIIAISLVPLFRVLAVIPSLWKKDKYDFFMFVATLLVVVVIDVNIGLAVGVGVSLLTVILRSRIVKATLLSPIMTEYDRSTDLFAPHYLCKASSLTRPECVTIIKFDCILYFANTNSFIQQIYKLTVNPMKEKAKIYHTSKKSEMGSTPNQTPTVTIPKPSAETVWTTLSSVESGKPVEGGEFDDHLPANHSALSDEQSNGIKIYGHADVDKPNLLAHSEDLNLVYSNDKTSLDESCEDLKDNDSVDVKVKKFIILDCSSISRIDTSGANAIRQLRADYDDVNISLWLASCSFDMLEVLRRHDVDLSWGVYPSIYDAVTVALNGDSLVISHL